MFLYQPGMAGGERVYFRNMQIRWREEPLDTRFPLVQVGHPIKLGVTSCTRFAFTSRRLSASTSLPPDDRISQTPRSEFNGRTEVLAYINSESNPLTYDSSNSDRA